jgi:hypothetical protein
MYERLVVYKWQLSSVMKLALFLIRLPELRHVDQRRRVEALREWQIELGRSWSFYFQEISTWVGSILFFGVIWHLAGQSWHLISVPTIIALLVALPLRNQLLYLPRRDVLREILERPYYAA